MRSCRASAPETAGAPWDVRGAFVEGMSFATVGEIADELPVSRPAVSQHLRVLKEAGLVSERRNGTRRLYRARPEGLADLKEFLTEFWDVRLDALKREIAAIDAVIEHPDLLPLAANA